MTTDRATETPTPETDEAIRADTGDSGVIANLANLSRKLERERDAALAKLASIRELLPISGDSYYDAMDIADAVSAQIDVLNEMKRLAHDPGYVQVKQENAALRKIILDEFPAVTLEDFEAGLKEALNPHEKV